MASAVQTNYPDGIAKGFPGLVSNQEPQVRISRTTQDAAGTGFGKPAFRGTVDGTYTGLTAATIADSKWLGITIADVTQEADLYPKGVEAGLLQKGCIFVDAAVAVTQGDKVYVTAAETFTNVATDNFEVPDAEWESTTTAAGLAEVRLK